MNKWWQLNIQDTAKLLQSDPDVGLDDGQAQLRLEQYGPNQLKEAEKISPWTIFWGQFEDFIVWILIGAAIVSGFMGEWIDAFAIVAIVILNAILGFIQEYRAEKSLAALKKLSSPMSRVIRAGMRQVLPSSQLTCGDLIEVEAGDNIPADCRIAWAASNFGVHEASLTGESTPVAKHTRPLEAKEIPLADRSNMLYMGTSVVAGKARAIVVETAMNTELGKIADMIQQTGRESTPLQKKLEQFGKWIVYACLILVTLVFLLGLLREGTSKLMELFLTSVSLAVAAIPEGLPAVVTIALAMGVQRMVKRHALIRKLPSVETLGCVSVICSDKTGTLTKNEMTVQAVFAGGKLFSVSGIGYTPQGEFTADGKACNPAQVPALQEALRIGVLCNGAQLQQADGIYKIIGDPTEGALLTAAAKASIDKTAAEADCPFVDEIPFDSQRKMMTMLRRQTGQIYAYTKGAPDVLLERCRFIQEGSTIRDLTPQDRDAILKANNQMTDQAMRVLALAWRKLDVQQTEYLAEQVEQQLIFAGLQAMIDPPRQEVKIAMAQCKQAGIQPVMITGDHKNTAVAIARQLDFFANDSIALTGEELDKLSETDLANCIERTAVYARVSPEHKLRIVKAWKHRGQIVAMTGDGVNDAPAVKEADIGVAMGITGTDVTKEVSDMVVTDDNFASIVAAVEEGRGIYDNIRKFIHYLLSCNTGEILVMFIASLIGWPVPLLPIHILWVNLVTDGLPALALGIDPVAKDIMKRPPRSQREAVITKAMGLVMLRQGAFIALASLLAFWLVMYIEDEGLQAARTAAFAVLACSQLFHAFNCRSATESIFKIGLLTNVPLLAAAGFSFLLQMAVIYLPFAQKIFKTIPLSLTDWLLVIAISSLPLWAMEIAKALRRYRNA